MPENEKPPAMRVDDYSYLSPQDLSFLSDTPTPHPPFLPLFSLHPSLPSSLFSGIDSSFIFLLAINYLVYINFGRIFH